MVLFEIFEVRFMPIFVTGFLFGIFSVKFDGVAWHDEMFSACQKKMGLSAHGSYRH